MRDTEEYEGFYIEPRSKQLDTGVQDGWDEIGKALPNACAGFGHEVMTAS